MAGEEKDAASRGRNAAERAREYMEESGIQPFLQDLGFLVPHNFSVGSDYCL